MGVKEISERMMDVAGNGRCPSPKGSSQGSSCDDSRGRSGGDNRQSPQSYYPEKNESERLENESERRDNMQSDSPAARSDDRESSVEPPSKKPKREYMHLGKNHDNSNESDSGIPRRKNSNKGVGRTNSNTGCGRSSSNKGVGRNSSNKGDGRNSFNKGDGRNSSNKGDGCNSSSNKGDGASHGNGGQTGRKRVNSREGDRKTSYGWEKEAMRGLSEERRRMSDDFDFKFEETNRDRAVTFDVIFPPEKRQHKMIPTWSPCGAATYAKLTKLENELIIEDKFGERCSIGHEEISGAHGTINLSMMTTGKDFVIAFWTKQQKKLGVDFTKDIWIMSTPVRGPGGIWDDTRNWDRNDNKPEWLPHKSAIFPTGYAGRICRKTNEGFSFIKMPHNQDNVFVHTRVRDQLQFDVTEKRYVVCSIHVSRKGFPQCSMPVWNCLHVGHTMGAGSPASEDGVGNSYFRRIRFELENDRAPNIAGQEGVKNGVLKDPPFGFGKNGKFSQYVIDNDDSYSGGNRDDDERGKNGGEDRGSNRGRDGGNKLGHSGRAGDATGMNRGDEGWRHKDNRIHHFVDHLVDSNPNNIELKPKEPENWWERNDGRPYGGIYREHIRDGAPPGESAKKENRGGKGQQQNLKTGNETSRNRGGKARNKSDLKSWEVEMDSGMKRRDSLSDDRRRAPSNDRRRAPSNDRRRAPSDDRRRAPPSDDRRRAPSANRRDDRDRNNPQREARDRSRSNDRRRDDRDRSVGRDRKDHKRPRSNSREIHSDEASRDKGSASGNAGGAAEKLQAAMQSILENPVLTMEQKLQMIQVMNKTAQQEDSKKEGIRNDTRPKANYPIRRRGEAAASSDNKSRDDRSNDKRDDNNRRDERGRDDRDRRIDDRREDIRSRGDRRDDRRIDGRSPVNRRGRDESIRRNEEFSVSGQGDSKRKPGQKAKISGRDPRAINNINRRDESRDANRQNVQDRDARGRNNAPRTAGRDTTGKDGVLLAPPRKDSRNRGGKGGNRGGKADNKAQDGRDREGGRNRTHSGEGGRDGSPVSRGNAKGKYGSGKAISDDLLSRVRQQRLEQYEDEQKKIPPESRQDISTIYAGTITKDVTPDGDHTVILTPDKKMVFIDNQLLTQYDLKSGQEIGVSAEPNEDDFLIVDMWKPIWKLMGGGPTPTPFPKYTGKIYKKSQIGSGFLFCKGLVHKYEDDPSISPKYMKHLDIGDELCFEVSNIRYAERVSPNVAYPFWVKCREVK